MEAEGYLGKSRSLASLANEISSSRQFAIINRNGDFPALLSGQSLAWPGHAEGAFSAGGDSILESMRNGIINDAISQLRKASAAFAVRADSIVVPK